MQKADARILVLDDEPDIVELYSDALSDLYQVDTFIDPEVAYSAACKNRYLIILSDFKMPKMNGGQLLEKIRMNGTLNSDTPFLFLSAYVDEVKHLLINESVFLLGKPVDLSELTRMIGFVTNMTKSVRKQKIA